ncbi:MAG TPA: hypothetical protein VFZ66_27885 [Herpetosiphonaceae bacterium]
MSCDQNRKTYVAALTKHGGPLADALGGSVIAPKVLEAVFNVARNQPLPDDPAERASLLVQAESATRLLFARMRQAGFTPPTHAANGLPRKDAQRGYGAIHQTIRAIEQRQNLPKLAHAILEQHTPSGAARHVLKTLPRVAAITEAERLTDEDRDALSVACDYLLRSDSPVPIRAWSEARNTPDWQIAARTTARAISLLAAMPNAVSSTTFKDDPGEVPIGARLTLSCGCVWERTARGQRETSAAWFRLRERCDGRCPNDARIGARRWLPSSDKDARVLGPQTWEEWAVNNAHCLPKDVFDKDDIGRLMGIPDEPATSEMAHVRRVERALVFAGRFELVRGGWNPRYRLRQTDEAGV